MATGESYDYRGFVIVLNGTGYNGAAVYGPKGFERLFCNETEAEEYVDGILQAEDYMWMDKEGK